LPIDIPSGLSGSSNKIIGKAVRADYTITFCRPKIPHVLFPAKKLCGKVFIANISIPDFVISKVNPSIFDITLESLPTLYKREKDSHKGDFRACCNLRRLRREIWCGYYVVSVLFKSRCRARDSSYSKSNQQCISSFVPEAMSLPVGNQSYLDIASIDEIADFLRDKTVVAMGPGLGRADKTGLLVKKLLKRT